MTAVLSAPAASSAGDREFELSTRDFDRVRSMIYQRAGINLQAGKQAMVYSRLSRRLRETGHDSFASYLTTVENGSGPSGDAEWQAFVNCLTTNLTSFFREAHHFPVLAEALAKRRGQPMRLWCSAASTGEEPYSLAMTAAEALGPKHQLGIVASDIDTNVLATAERGVYGADAQGLTPERLRAHFLRGTGSNAGSIRVRPELARTVSFRPFNLMSRRWDLGEPFDFVFCRNVMIYFDAATQRRVLEGIHAAMKPGGLLFVGHSENFTDAKHLFLLRGKTVYERVGA